ncbi:hypothetical protein MAUB1S_04062 [Mycolicibacterium aubagnense]
MYTCVGTPARMQRATSSRSLANWLSAWPMVCRRPLITGAKRLLVEWLDR